MNNYIFFLKGAKLIQVQSIDAINKHKKSYIDGDEHEEDSKSLGTAAAMNALKLFTQGETGNQQGKGAFLGLALSEASKVCNLGCFYCPIFFFFSLYLSNT